MDPKFIFNGIDLSAYVKDVQFTAKPDVDTDPIVGGYPLREFTITGIWENRPVNVSARCGICGQLFIPGDEGTPILVHKSSGLRMTACPSCVVPLIEQGLVVTE